MKWTLMILLTGAIMVQCSLTPGVKVIELPVKTDPTVSFKVWFKVGSQNDPAGKEGLAALTAEMAADASTDSNSYEQILEKLYPMAAGYSASTDKEMTVISGRVHKDYLDEYYSLLKQAILTPAFTEDDFNRIKDNMVNYLENSLRYSNDEAFGKEALYQFVFKNTSYDHPNEGLIESVKSITLDDVKAFYQKYYTRDNVVLGIGGGYDQAMVRQVKKDFAMLPAGVVTQPAKPAVEPIDGMKVVLVEKEAQSTAISFGFPIDVLRGSKDFYALWIANSWFGEHRNSSSHLYQVIREARGMNYGDYSYIEYFPRGWARDFPPANAGRHQQLFEVWIRPVQNAEAQFALRAAIRELQLMVENGLTQDEFDLTVKFLKKYHLHYAPTTGARLGYKLDDEFYGIPDHLAMFAKMFDTLTLEDVNSAIKKHLQFKNMKIAMITRNAAVLKDALIANSPSPKSYQVEKPQAILDEDKIIQNYKLDIGDDDVTIIPADQMFVKP
ncbi:insulinase family protein [candidate division KSB1 bacterium]|nr:insulinase family protein [candidate division KSB1 bacterium]